MSLSKYTITKGELEFCIFPAEGDAPAFASVNRCVDPKLSLKYIRIPSSIKAGGVSYPVTEISENAFAETNAERVYVPRSVTAIRTRAFSEAKLRSLEGCKGVRVIEQNAFCNCLRLAGTLRLPAAEQILHLAFQSCAIEEVVLPKCLKGIFNDAFLECKKLKRVSMHGSTKILYNPDLHRFGSFLPHKAALRLRAPFSQVKKAGHCLVSADNKALYHVFSGESDHVSIPGSIVKIVGNPFENARLQSLTFCKSGSTAPLPVSLERVECREIICRRAVTFFFLPKANPRLDIYCASGIIDIPRHNSKNFTIHVGKNARLIRNIYTLDSPNSYVFEKGVKEISELRFGKTTIGPDVKTVHKIVPNSESGLDFPVYQVTMLCTAPPEVEKFDKRSLANMELRVPEGFTDAYKRHRVWGLAGRITDGKTVAVDRISKTVMKSRKKAMTYEMAESVALKFAAMKLDDTATVFRRDNIIEVNLDLNIATNEMEGIKYTKYLSIDEATNSDTWDALANEAYNIKMFLCTGTIL